MALLLPSSRWKQRRINSFLLRKTLSRTVISQIAFVYAKRQKRELDPFLFLQSLRRMIWKQEYKEYYPAQKERHRLQIIKQKTNNFFRSLDYPVPENEALPWDIFEYLQRFNTRNSKNKPAARSPPTQRPHRLEKGALTYPGPTENLVLHTLSGRRA